MVDYHIHSNISTDGVDSMQAMVDAAVAKNLTEICFTEHYDLDYPIKTSNDWCSDMVKYRQVFDALKTEIKVKRGIEIGLTDGVYGRLDTLIRENAFDFVIASQHLIGRGDPYMAEYYIGKEKVAVYQAYLEEMLRHLKAFDNYDVVGHIGYLTRFCPYDNPELLADDFDVLDEILKTVIVKGKGIEINTVGFKKFNQSIPSVSIIKRYFRLGGEIITVGSDAHDVTRVGDHIDWAYDTLKSIGFRYVTTYLKRKKIWRKI